MTIETKARKERDENWKNASALQNNKERRKTEEEKKEEPEDQGRAESETTEAEEATADR